MKYRKISIEQLQVGMFIHEMDLPWLQNPFLRQRVLINTQSDIDKLRTAGAKALTIDLSQGCDISVDEPQETEVSVTPAPAAREQKTTPVAPQPQDKTKLLEANQRAANALKEQAVQLINDISHKIERGEGVSQQQLDHLVDNLVDNLKTNNQAILALLAQSQNHQVLATHLYNVMILCLSLGLYLKLDDETTALLGQAALLHDIGWTKLPAYLFQKGREFSVAEQQLARQHVGISYNLIKAMSDIRPEIVTLLASYFKLVNNTPSTSSDTRTRLANILFLTDHYEEMVHGLKGQKAHLPAKAMKLLFQKVHERKSDERVMSSLVRLLGVYPLGSAVKLKSGQKGLIVRVQPDSPLKPEVLIIYDAQGNLVTPPMVIELDPAQGNDVDTFLDPDNSTDDPLKKLSMPSQD